MMSCQVRMPLLDKHRRHIQLFTKSTFNQYSQESRSPIPAPLLVFLHRPRIENATYQNRIFI